VREERRKNVEKAKLRATFVSGEEGENEGVADLGVEPVEDSEEG
jgi:hypothetical protein